jgi:hypothetical protein
MPSKNAADKENYLHQVNFGHGEQENMTNLINRDNCFWPMI